MIFTFLLFVIVVLLLSQDIVAGNLLIAMALLIFSFAFYST